MLQRIVGSLNKSGLESMRSKLPRSLLHRSILRSGLQRCARTLLGFAGGLGVLAISTQAGFALSSGRTPTVIPRDAKDLHIGLIRPDLSVSSDCTAYEKPVAWRLCITRTPGSPSQDVMYFFHGAFQDEYFWSTERFKGIRDSWKRMGHPAPIVASISFGKLWFVTPKNGGILSGLLDVLTRNVVPEIERKLGHPSGSRLLMGESMGGFNALQLLLTQQNFFKRVVLSCPALDGLSPYASFDELSRYIQSTGALTSWVVSYNTWLKGSFPNRGTWERTSPFIRAQKELRAGSPPLYISCGSKDEYGFQQPDEFLARAAAHNQVPQVVWEPIQNGVHCDFDSEMIAAFLAAP